MDHFALPDDDLSRAQASGSLQRNFMGYTNYANSDLVAVGMSAISHVGDSFSQNHRELKAWSQAVDDGQLPVARGLTLTHDDLVRGAVIADLMCRGEVEFAAIEQRFGVNFAAYFGDALATLKAHVDDGLVVLDSRRLGVTRRGRLLLRSVAMCFDAYLPATPTAADATYSRAV
jgi:oxygen-independent coproporphyrinogen-3 oxidase